MGFCITETKLCSWGRAMKVVNNKDELNKYLEVLSINDDEEILSHLAHC